MAAVEKELVGEEAVISDVPPEGVNHMVADLTVKVTTEALLGMVDVVATDHAIGTGLTGEGINHINTATASGVNPVDEEHGTVPRKDSDTIFEANKVTDESVKDGISRITVEKHKSGG